MNESFFIWLIIWNIVVFILYGIDKGCAVKNKWRISEKTLIAVAFLMGAFGASLGMKTFRHKTKKPMFRAIIAAAVVVNAAVLIFIERI